jgi:hypothetical protein
MPSVAASTCFKLAMAPEAIPNPAGLTTRVEEVLHRVGRWSVDGRNPSFGLIMD